jgi:hypothetical protein
MPSLAAFRWGRLDDVRTVALFTNFGSGSGSVERYGA